jgi:hypothetical protein
MVDVKQLRTTMKASDAEKSKVAVTGPALPTSTQDGTNETGKTLLGRISAGTVTVFKINGVTVGGMTTGEWFFLKPGDTFNITYSVAPTLQFFEW